MYRVYKITSDLTELVYIGSTCEKLSSRLARHKNDLKHYKLGKRYKYPASSKIILDIDPEPKIELIEKVSSKDAALERETYYINQYRMEKICVNRMTPGYNKKTRVNCPVCDTDLAHGSMSKHLKRKHNE